MELLLRVNDEMSLFGYLDRAEGVQKGVIILIHGLGEHSGRYTDWVEKFSEAGYSVYRIDLPGHGKSEGKRGHIKNFAIYRSIIGSVVSRANNEFPGQPVILYGHSLGGTIALDYLVSGASGIDLSVITSPWLKLSFEPPKSKLILAAIVKSIIPGLLQPTGLIAEHISHEKVEVEKYIKDPLVHGKISVALFSGTFKAARNILKGDKGVTIPLLLVHGTEDKITSPTGSAELATKSNLTTLRLWDGGFHELHNEPFREELFLEIGDWLRNNLQK